MTNLHSDATRTARAQRRRIIQALAVGILAAGATVSMAVPALADTSAYQVIGSTTAGSQVVTDPATAKTSVAALTNGTKVTIDCGIRGRSVHGDTVWHHITAPAAGYISDYYTNTPGFNRFIRGEATCTPATTPSTPSATPSTPSATPSTPSAPTTPATPITTPATPAAKRGATITYNEGVGGSCVYYAIDRFHQLTGVYPKAFGDAKYLAGSAAANGWTVGAQPRVDSLAVFQPGQNGAAAPTGHAAWVEQVSGDRIYIAEMNAPSAWVVTHRWLTPAAGVQFIYTA